jgi:hypothetical protein
VIDAVVVRPWHGRDYGAGGKTVFLTNAPVETPLQPFINGDDRGPIANCCIKEAKPQWALGHPPQTTEIASTSWPRMDSRHGADDYPGTSAPKRIQA